MATNQKSPLSRPVVIGDILVLKEMVPDLGNRESQYGSVIATIGESVKVFEIKDIGDKVNGLVYHVTRCGDPRMKKFVIRDGYFIPPESPASNE